MTQPSMPRVVASFAAIYLVWGSTFLAIRWAVETIPPFPMMALRCLLGGAIPLFVPLLAWSVLGSGRPSLRTALALAAAFAGVAILVAHQGAGGGLSATD